MNLFDVTTYVNSKNVLKAAQQQRGRNKSFSNKAEVVAVFQLVHLLMGTGLVDQEEIGIVVPYKNQV